VKRRHIEALAWAVREAEGWRGSMTGNPDPVPLAEFDAKVASAKEALREIRKAEREAKQPKAVYDKH